MISCRQGVCSETIPSAGSLRSIRRRRKNAHKAYPTAKRGSSHNAPFIAPPLWVAGRTTIGEKIGKKGMTYAQGMSAQMTAAVSIGLASYTGMPVSTTHVLSSSVAGTMVVDGGGLQRKTVTSILMAWVFTLPAAVLLSGGLYWLSLQFL